MSLAHERPPVKSRRSYHQHALHAPSALADQSVHPPLLIFCADILADDGLNWRTREGLSFFGIAEAISNTW
jgi:hypothetical protein